MSDPLVSNEGVCRPIPGATVTIKAWEKLLFETAELLRNLAETSPNDFTFLAGVLPDEVTLCPPSTGLSEVNTEALMRALTRAETQVSALQAEHPEEANWGELTKRVSRLLEKWRNFVASDFNNEQFVRSVSFTLLGPRSVVEAIIERVQKFADEESLAALKGQRVGFFRDVLGDIPVVLDEQGGPFPLFARGENVTDLLSDANIAVVSQEELLQFAQKFDRARGKKR
jgi:hypothetical protein